MRIIKSTFEILHQGSGIKGLYQHIEKVGRTCYKSEDKITEDSAKGFVDRLIKSGHGAMLEHGTVFLEMPLISLDYEYAILKNNPYTRVQTHLNQTEIDTTAYITTNLRVLVENFNNWEELLSLYMVDPSSNHLRRLCVKFICDRGVSHELVRHRVMSFAQESTRYCNYSKDKFQGLTFIEPTWLPNLAYQEIDSMAWVNKVRDVDSEALFDPKVSFLYSCAIAEILYLHLIESGKKPQEARQVLPNALKTEIVVTGFAKDWDHLFGLRCAKDAHPDIRDLMIRLVKDLGNPDLGLDYYF